MKNLVSFLSVLLIALLLNSCVSVRAGANFATERSKNSFSGESSTTTNGPQQRDMNASRVMESTINTSKTGFYFGVFLSDVAITDNLEVQPEVNFVGITDLNQIQVPILAKYTVVEKFSMYAGPNFGYLLDAPAGLDSFNLGADFGVSYDITDDILIESRYTLGFTNLLENGSSSNSVKISSFSVGAGYRF